MKKMRRLKPPLNYLIFAQSVKGRFCISFSIKEERGVGAAGNREAVFPAHAVGDAPENYVFQDAGAGFFFEAFEDFFVAICLLCQELRGVFFASLKNALILLAVCVH